MDIERINPKKTPASLGEPRADQTHAGGPALPRILVVDDELVIRQLNTRMLVRSGYAVDTAEDGDAAWQALHAASYDLMITDNHMPKVTGVDLLKKVHAAGLALPVIMATGLMPEHEFARHPWLQPAAVLLKPYTMDELLGKVQEVLLSNHGLRAWVAPAPHWPGQSPAQA